MDSYSPTSNSAYTYANGQLTSTTDGNGKKISYVYNYAGQVACEGYPVSSTAANCGTFASLGTGSSSNSIVKDTYDTAGRLSTVVDWLGNTTTYAYTNTFDPFEPSSITYPSGSGVSANYGYDNDDNLTSLTAGTSSLTSINDSWRFDADERTATTTVNSVVSSWTDYNADNQTTNATNLATSTSNDIYTIAKNGEITSDAAPSGSTTSFGYNAGDELCWSANVSSSASCTSPPTASVETNYSYTSNGQRSSAATTTGSGTTTTTYAWNPYGELCNVSSTSTACSSTPTTGTSYNYNGDGLRTTTTNSSPSSGTISAVGSLKQTGGTGKTTLSVNPQHVGDALVLAVGVFSPGATVSSVSGGGSTGWAKVSETTVGGDTELWLGTVTTTGTSTITVTFSASVSSKQTELDAQEYQSSIGSSATWALDVAGNASTSSSSTTVNLPPLTPTGSSELYVDYTPVDNLAVAGSTTGFTYDVTSSGSLYAYNTGVSAAVNPTAGQTPAGSYVEAAALLTATGSSSSSVTDSTWDVVSGGSLPLNINDATTVSSVTTNTSYIYGNLLFGGTAPVEQITTPASGGATVRYLVSNQSGVQGVYSSTGALQELALYSLYGVQTIMSGTKVTPFGYQGSYTDSTGLIYLIHRYYDPIADQFLSIDPDVVGTDQPYIYVGDNPLNSCDPLGSDPKVSEAQQVSMALALAVSMTSISIPLGTAVLTTGAAIVTFTASASVSAPTTASITKPIDVDQSGTASVKVDGTEVSVAPSDIGDFYVTSAVPSVGASKTVVVKGHKVTVTVTVSVKPAPTDWQPTIDFVKDVVGGVVWASTVAVETCEANVLVCIAGGS